MHISYLVDIQYILLMFMGISFKMFQGLFTVFKGKKNCNNITWLTWNIIVL